MMKVKTIGAMVLSFAVLGGLAGFAQRSDHEKKVQNVKLTVDDSGGYAVAPSKVTRGVPVRMAVDLQTVKGCARTVVISAFDVKKTVRPDDAVIEFTPTKSGTIDVVCGMNMVKGSFSVVEP